MTRKDIKEGVLAALYIGTFLALVAGLSYDVVRDYKRERKQKIEQGINNKTKLQSYINFNNVRQK